MEKGLVSVIVPAYRCAPYLAESVRSALSQRDARLEVIVIDDCSGDGTWALVQRLAAEDGRVRGYQNHCNLGAAGTRNRGPGCLPCPGGIFNRRPIPGRSPRRAPPPGTTEKE